MYSLDPPTRNGMEDFDSIVARRNNDAAVLLNRNRGDIATAYGAYLIQSGNGTLLPPIDIGEDVAEELKANFRLLDKGSSYSFLRDEILSSAHLDACPYCNFTNVDTIDHSLPRAVYPEFSALAQNLVPSCGPCNRKKGENCFHSSGLNLMHPYFVGMPGEPILFADVLVTEAQVTWQFYLQRNSSISGTDFDSIANLFNLLGLATFYYRISVGDIIDRKGHLEALHLAGGAVEVERYLHLEAESSRKSRGENYWKTALLRACARCSEFCDEGFRRI